MHAHLQSTISTFDDLTRACHAAASMIEADSHRCAARRALALPPWMAGHRSLAGVPQGRQARRRWPRTPANETRPSSP